MVEQPSGTVTLVFTDIEGSTRLLHALGQEAYREALAEHRRVVREACAHHAGYEVDYEGDSFFYSFASASEAVLAVEEAMRGLADGPIRIRVGVHTGQPGLDPPKYVGVDVHLAARVMAAGHGGQVVLTDATRLLVHASIRDLGEHRLKDFERPVALCQLGERPFPPLKTIANTNLPHPASSFIGRGHEVREVLALLRESRLVTLVGPGGSGKTRLAIEAAAELVGEFRAGVFFVGLAGLEEPSLVSTTIGQTLGASEELARHIEDRELLLLLDNFEQVVEAAPDLARLVEECPNLRLLVTSRELLRVRGEMHYTVEPLARADAVALFCARAGVKDSATVQEICSRLDDLPLALELAAARARVLSTDQIMERLGQRLDLFRGGRDADPRQQTLRATINWSHSLLTPAEQLIFARLAVFAGGCTLDAAEAIAGAELEPLQSLVEKSLLRHSRERFWMLETIREYALDQLERSGEDETIKRLHADWMLELAAETGFAHDATTEERHDVVRAELNNVRAALGWASANDAGVGIRLMADLEMFWVAFDPQEAQRWLGALLERQAGMPEALRALAFKMYGGFIFLCGDQEQGLSYFKRALELYQALGDQWGAALTGPRTAVPLLYAEPKDLARARALCEASLAEFRKAGFERGEAEALVILSYVLQEEGRLEEAVDLALQAEVLTERTGWTWWRNGCLDSAARALLALGRLEQAAGYARSALELARSIDSRREIIGGLSVLACVAAASDDAGRAGRLWGAIEAEVERARIGFWEAGTRDELAEELSAVAGSEFEHGIAEGRALTLDQAVELALSEPREPSTSVGASR